MSKKTPDARLRPYATDIQWKYLCALAEHSSQRKVAKLLGVSRATLQAAEKSVKKKATLRGYAPEYGLVHEVPEGLVIKGTSIRYNEAGVAEQYWNKTTRDGRDDAAVPHIPDPKLITKISTNYGPNGEVLSQWIAEKPEEQDRLLLWNKAAEAMACELPRARRIVAPRNVTDHFMLTIPVGDHHLGMHAWREETGADYDLKIAERILCDSFGHIIQTSPKTKRCAILILGDFLHYDSYRPETPQHKNLLDADSRFPKMVQVAIRTIRAMIAEALSRNEEVILVFEVGNHDPASTVWLRTMFSALYENEPRVKVDTSPRNVHYIEHGKVMVVTTHGDKFKPADLPSIVAADEPKMWGRTEFRYGWTGHVHHDQAKDYRGMKWESARVLPPEDAYAAFAGYRSMRDIKGVLYDARFGEANRQTVNASMFL